MIPPDVVDGGQEGRPVLVRNSKLRYATSAKQRTYKTKTGQKYGNWLTIEVTIPREIVEITGWEVGMTLCMEAYVDGRIRVFPAGDVLSREEEKI